MDRHRHAMGQGWGWFNPRDVSFSWREGKKKTREMDWEGQVAHVSFLLGFLLS